eukprot:evm.model.scf_3.9 EVM.evm.TU.scf_3.9   scf_3:179653-180544(+)
MAALDMHNSLVTRIVLYKVRPGQQAAAVEALRGLFSLAAAQPGFVSASLHRSLDGAKAAIYAQWCSAQAVTNFRALPEAAALTANVGELVETADHRGYEIVCWRCKYGIPQIVAGQYFVSIAEFRAGEGEQAGVVERVKAHVEEVGLANGAECLALHRSLDGGLAVCYGQWDSEGAAGGARREEDWDGVEERECHAYEVVMTLKGKA